MESINIKSEIQLQATAWQWSWNTYPETRRCFFHVPNGGARNKIEATHLKASGVIAGIPDMILVWKGKCYGFEFKRPGIARFSPEQVKVHHAWAQQDTQVYLINDFEQFKELFKSIIL